MAIVTPEKFKKTHNVPEPPSYPRGILGMEAGIDSALTRAEECAENDLWNPTQKKIVLSVQRTLKELSKNLVELKSNYVKTKKAVAEKEK